MSDHDMYIFSEEEQKQAQIADAYGKIIQFVKKKLDEEINLEVKMKFNEILEFMKNERINIVGRPKTFNLQAFKD